MKTNLSVEISSLKLKNPVITASGTFGYGDEITDLIDINKLGAITTKTITLHPKHGNPPPRIVETSSGLLNSIGLQNIGVDKFIQEKLPVLGKYDVPVIVSIAGETPAELVKISEKIEKTKDISAIELNLSCPNLKKEIISKDPACVRDIIEEVKRIVKVPLIAKLSPMVTDLVNIAQNAEVAGADALTISNTYTGMAIDINTWEPRLKNIIGGLSGPCIKPLALKCVWDVCRNVDIPIIGCGGIATVEDAIEFILAGATLVSVGSANFIDAQATLKIITGIENYLGERKINSINEIRGRMKL